MNPTLSPSPGRAGAAEVGVGEEAAAGAVECDDGTDGAAGRVSGGRAGEDTPTEPDAGGNGRWSEVGARADGGRTAEMGSCFGRTGCEVVSEAGLAEGDGVGISRVGAAGFSGERGEAEAVTEGTTAASGLAGGWVGVVGRCAAVSLRSVTSEIAVSRVSGSGIFSSSGSGSGTSTGGGGGRTKFTGAGSTRSGGGTCAWAASPVASTAPPLSGSNCSRRYSAVILSSELDGTFAAVMPSSFAFKSTSRLSRFRSLAIS